MLAEEATPRHDRLDALGGAALAACCRGHLSRAGEHAVRHRALAEATESQTALAFADYVDGERAIAAGDDVAAVACLLGMTNPLPMDRLLWVNPGTTVELNGRTLHAIRPPSFDAPETTAFYDTDAATLFSADSFGALLQAPALDAGDIAPSDLADGMQLWSTIDSPWLTHTDRRHLEQTLRDLRQLGARRVLSAHLPPAHDFTGRLIDTLATVPGATPWVGPDQATLDQLLASVTA